MSLITCYNLESFAKVFFPQTLDHFGFDLMVNIIQVVCMHFTEKYLFLHWICIPIVLSHCKRIYSKILIMQHTATNKQPTNKYRPLHLQRDLFILHIYSVEISYVFDKTSQFVIETRTALTAKTEKCY